MVIPIAIECRKSPLQAVASCKIGYSKGLEIKAAVVEIKKLALAVAELDEFVHQEGVVVTGGGEEEWGF